MKKYLILVMLVIFSMVCVSQVSAQAAISEDQYDIEQLQQEIRANKREIREAAKSFLVEELPVVIEIDPEMASQGLQMFSSTLSSLGDDEVSYLLGHMYARIGEDDKAIAIFDSLLRTELNEDARKMLNLVLYRRLTDLLEAGDRVSARDYLRLIIFDYYNTGEFFPSYLYIFADLSADNRDYQEVLELIDEYNFNRDAVLNILLPAKERALDNLDRLDMEAFFASGSERDYQLRATIIDQVMIDLTAISSEMVQMQGMPFIDQVVQAHNFEIEALEQLKVQLLEFASAEKQISDQLQPALSHIDAIRANLDYYDRVLILFDNYLQQNYLKLSGEAARSEEIFEADLYLDRIYQTDRIIETYEDMLVLLDEVIDSGDYPQYQQRAMQERAWVLAELDTAQMQRATFVDDLQFAQEEDKAMLLDILGEYKALKQERLDLTETTDLVEDYIRNNAHRIISANKRDELRGDIANNISELRFPEDRHGDIISGYSHYLKHIEFITLHLLYRDLMSHYDEFLQMQDKLPVEELVIEQDYFRQQHIDLISYIESFISEYPSFNQFIQPDGSNLVGTADLYYKLGELQYYAYPADPQLALTSYRQAVQLDADFPERDLALYNVAFISSELKRVEIDQNKIEYRETGGGTEQAPANSLYSEGNFRETLAALQEIVDEYPQSPLYEEATYRMGLLYFRFAEDSDDPDHYHALAIEYFDRIIDQPESPLYHEALYQRGWVRLNSFDEDELRQAMADFIRILHAVDSDDIDDPQLALDYKADAIDNIAYCLIALDGTNFQIYARGVDEIQTVFQDYSNEETIRKVLDKAVENKLNMGVSIQAIDFLKLRISQNPLALENPVILDSILVLYHNSGQRLREGESLDEITQRIYEELTEDYNQDSDWYQAHKDRDISKQMDIVENAYQQRGNRLFNNYAANINHQNLQTYEEHAQRYNAFAQVFMEDYEVHSAKSDSIMVNVYAVLADKTQDTDDYLNAINKLYTYNEDHPNNDQFYENEELAMNYARNVYAQVSESLADIPDAEGSRTEEAFAFLSISADRFMLVSNSELHSNPSRQRKALEVTLLLADIQFGREQYEDAVKYYSQALQQVELLSDADTRDTYLKLAEISIRQERPNDAEEWLRLALPLAESEQDIANINQDILVQIQSSYTDAAASGDYATEAAERLRLADSLDPSFTADILGHRVAAVEAYINAQAYQDAIDLLMVIAESDDNADAVYARYNKAYEIADEMMEDPELARNIEQQFMDLYPASNYTFRLRLANISGDAENNPDAAAEEYLALYEEVTAGELDAGEVQPHDLMADAILMYAKSGNIETEYELRHRFIELYPDHPDVIPYMEYMAKGYLDRDEMDQYTALAREILERDPDKSTYYQFVADTQLQRIAGRFDAAYMNEDYETALEIRDEYLAAEASYIGEGLSFANQGVHDIFAAVQAEYDHILLRIAFLERYDQSLDNLNNSAVFSRTPAQQIRVVAVTTWDRNLNAGDRRFPRYQETIAAEVNKVLAVIREANESGYFIDNDRRLRAMDLIQRIYERAAEVVSTQLDTYFRQTNEAAYYRDQYPGEALDNLIAQFSFQQTQNYLNNAVSWQYEIYRQYHLAGYENEYTIAARESLEERGLLAEYRTQEQVLNELWGQELIPSGETVRFSQIQSPKGQNLGTADIPAGQTLRLTRKINLSLEPDFAYLQIVFPMDMEVKLNGSMVSSAWVPVDSLQADKPISTRYSYLIPGELFVPGENTFEIDLINGSSDSLQMALALQLLTSHQRILANIPLVEVALHTNQGWKIVTNDPETGEDNYDFASEAAEWGITWDQIQNMDRSAARPIWVSELEGPVDSITFETEFTLDSEFREGIIDLIAPESVTVYLNGAQIGSALFDYDPDPLAIYKGQVLIPAENVVIGKNVLRFEVSNNSAYRGFLASIFYKKAGKEEIR